MKVNYIRIGYILVLLVFFSSGDNAIKVQ